MLLFWSSIMIGGYHYRLRGSQGDKPSTQFDAQLIWWSWYGGSGNSERSIPIRGLQSWIPQVWHLLTNHYVASTANKIKHKRMTLGKLKLLSTNKLSLYRLFQICVYLSIIIENPSVLLPWPHVTLHLLLVFPGSGAIWIELQIHPLPMPSRDVPRAH